MAAAALSAADVAVIREWHRAGWRVTDLAAAFHVHRSTLYRALVGKRTYKGV